MTFWMDKPLKNLNQQEWESLCDGCGRCCLEKLEDLDTGEISYTDVACTLLNIETCQCSSYSERHRFMPDCIALSPDNVADLKWMPSTCAYRLLASGKNLPDWHPLVSGDPNSVITSGLSVKGRCVDQKDVKDLEDHLVDWPA